MLLDLLFVCRFNAAVPFVITVVFTLLGMILGGRQAIIDQPDNDEKLDLTIVNIFKMADSVAALIWASCLATVVLFIMLRLQKILKLSEFMEVCLIKVECSDYCIHRLGLKASKTFLNHYLFCYSPGLLEQPFK